MERKKGQAAMEFLMTYGWAILAALIVIAALAYFGVFSPSKFLPNACTLTAPLGCVDFRVSEGSGTTIIMRNGAGNTITVNNVTLSGCNTLGSNTVTYNSSMLDGQTAQLQFTCSGLKAGSKFRGDIAVDYKKADASFDAESTGSVSAQIVG